MLAAGKDLQVLRPIIEPVAIAVVHLVRYVGEPSEVPRNHPMLNHITVGVGKWMVWPPQVAVLRTVSARPKNHPSPLAVMSIQGLVAAVPPPTRMTQPASNNFYVATTVSTQTAVAWGGWPVTASGG